MPLLLAAAAVARAGAGKDRPHAAQRQGRRDAADPAVDRWTAWRATRSSGRRSSRRGTRPSARCSSPPPSAPCRRCTIVDGPGRDRRQLTWYDRRRVSRDLVSPSFDPADGNTFVLRPVRRRPRSRCALSLRHDDRRETSLAGGRQDPAIPPVWSRQGKWLAYDSTERNGKDRDLYVMQPSDPKTKRRLARVRRRVGPAGLVAGRHDDAGRTRSFGNSENYLWRVDVKTGEKKAITPRGRREGGFGSTRGSRTTAGRSTPSATAADGEWRIWRCDVAKCAWTPVTRRGHRRSTVRTTGSGFEISPDGSMLATVARSRHVNRAAACIDLTTLKPRPLPAIPKGIVTRIHWRPGLARGRFHARVGQGAGRRLFGGHVTRHAGAVDDQRDDVQSDVLPSPEVVEWKSFDGQAISGDPLSARPKFTGPRPVLDPHSRRSGRARARACFAAAATTC